MATTPSKGFLHSRTLQGKYCMLYIIVQYCLYFSHLQVKNKLSEGLTTPAFILDYVSMVANSLFLAKRSVNAKMQLPLAC
jgi:hypothetical protein